jgi:hypothetical protein
VSANITGLLEMAVCCAKPPYDFCREMLNELCSDAFPLFSTRRQFRRYLKDWSTPLWSSLAQAALDALGDEY